MHATTLTPSLSRSLAAIARAASARRCLASVVDDTRAAARRELGVDRFASPMAREVDALAERVHARVTGQASAHAPDVRARLRAHLTAAYVGEIARRGGETAIEEERRSIELAIADRQAALALLRADGWRYYSRRFGARRAELAYLAGKDDNG